MKQIETITKAAGIDVGKLWLDAAVHGLGEVRRFARTQEGLALLIAWLTGQGVGRVGLEASGGYEKRVTAALYEAGLEVVVHQPLEVRLYARLKRQKAKSDSLDAIVIAAATAHAQTITAAKAPLLQDLAERLTAYEQVSDQIVRLKTFCEHLELADLKAQMKDLIDIQSALKRKLLVQIVSLIKACPALVQRYQLLQSLPGIGPVIAAALVIRMPELGAMKRGQASSLIGVAPFDRDSGQWKGQRFISGGRARPRRMLYLAAVVAKQRDNDFKAFARRLADKGKPAKVALVAIMRKLIEAANLVLSRQQPWIRQTT